MKDRTTYQLISASSIGRKEQEFLIGKHSGKSTIMYYLTEAKLPITDEDCLLLVDKVKEQATSLKRAISKEELLDIYFEIQAGKKHTITNYQH